jgi:hypothetical protein
MPPLFYGGDGEYRRVLSGADGDPSAVIGVDRSAFRLPLLTDLLVSFGQIFFPGIDADHRVAAGQELLGEFVDVPELSVAIGRLLAFQRPAGSL